MSNQEKIQLFLTKVLKERLIFFFQRAKRDLSYSGAMYFIQEVKVIKNQTEGFQIQ